MEKRTVANNEDGKSRKNDDGDKEEKANGKKESPRKNRRTNNSAKIADVKTGGIKAKVRRKLKEDLKEIVDDEIEKRL